MDVSKQVIGGVMVHMANLLLSLISSGSWTPAPMTVGSVLVPREAGPPPPSRDDAANPCSFYLLNLGIDTTVGVVILIYALRTLHRLVAMCPVPGLKTGVDSGYYGDPPRWSFWLKQASLYFTGLMIMKFIVWLIFTLFPWLGAVGDWLLAWTDDNRRLQVFFVMFVSGAVCGTLRAAAVLTR